VSDGLVSGGAGFGGGCMISCVLGGVGGGRARERSGLEHGAGTRAGRERM